MDVKVYSLAADGDKYLTPHFQVKEFRCRDGSDVVLIHEQLPWDLESIRYQASQEHGKGKEIPLIINSGYRTVAYNSTLKNAASTVSTFTDTLRISTCRESLSRT